MILALPKPRPDEEFTVREIADKDVDIWYHVYSTRTYPGTTAMTFAQGWGNTRFAPIFEAADKPVHTYYIANDREATYLESVLHDVALSPPGSFEVASLDYFHLVTLRLPPVISYVSFHTHDLPRMQNITRSQMIDSPAAFYADTQSWAQAAYLQRPKAQAIGYGSKRNDAGRCLMLFGQRLPDPPFEIVDEKPLGIGALRAEILALIRSLKLHEV